MLYIYSEDNISVILHSIESNNNNDNNNYHCDNSFFCCFFFILNFAIFLDLLFYSREECQSMQGKIYHFEAEDKETN